MSSWIVCILAVILEDGYAVSVGDYGHIAWCASGREPKRRERGGGQYIFLTDAGRVHQHVPFTSPKYPKYPCITPSGNELLEYVRHA